MTMSSQAVAAPVRRAGLSWPLLLGAGCFLAFCGRRGLLRDGDPYLHVTAGQWMFSHWTIPSVDPFSQTLRGSVWVAHEWLSEIVYAAIYRAAGWAGVTAVAALAFAVAIAVLSRYLLRHVAPIYVLLLAALSAGMAASHLLARPHALTYPIIVLWGVALARAREERRLPSWGLPPLMVLWANLHGSFPLGLGLIAAFAAEAFLEASSSTDRWRVIRQWGGFFGVTLLASLVTPYGIGSLKFVADLHENTFAMNNIGEWRSPDFHNVQELEVWLLIALAALLTRGLKLPLIRMVLLVGLVHMALRYQRHIEILGFLAPIIAARPMGAQWFAGDSRKGSAVDRYFTALAQPASKAACCVVCLLLAAVSLMTMRSDAVRPVEDVSPAAALQAVRDAYPGDLSVSAGPVFNYYSFGGYLIFEGVPPFVDGRADLYGDAYLTDYAHAVFLDRNDALPQLLDRYHIGWTLLPPDVPAVALLDHLSGWRRLFSDKTAVVHVRTTAQ